MGLFGIKKENLSLSGLIDIGSGFTREDILTTEQEVRKEQDEYERKYGDDWWSIWLKDKGFVQDYDTCMKEANEAIYYGNVPQLIPSVKTHGISEYSRKIRARLDEIYREGEPKWHAPGEKWVVERLLDDALKTGKWKELPDCLQEEYHRRAGDGL